jgi:rhomboid protease GluP
MADGTIAHAQVTRIDPPSVAGLCTVSFAFVPVGQGRTVTGKQKATAAAISAAGIAVGSTVQVNYLPKWPEWAFIDALTLADVEAAANLSEDAAFYYVAFGPVPNAPRWAANFGCFGSGEIMIDSSTLSIAGNRRRPFLLPKREQHKILLSDIVDAERTGDVLRFEGFDSDGEARKFRFQTVKESDADAISQKLPSTKTKSFSPILAEQIAFSKALLEITPKARVTPALILANLLMFAIATALGAGLIEINPVVMIHLGTNYTPLTLGGQWWRLLTSMFLHFGLLHIAFNMFALYVNGMAVERIFGGVRYLVIYLVAGICGSLASLLWHPLVNGAGASGAIFGVLGALIAFLVRKEGGVPPSVLKTQLRAAAVFVGYNLLNGASHQGIDNAAHLGGLAGGFIMGFILSRPLQADRISQDWTKQWLTAAAAACLATVAFSYLIAERSQPAIRTLGGFKLGLSQSELVAAKGEPIHRAAGSWVYNAVDARHNGVLTAEFGTKDDHAVRAIEYIGDQESAPSELPYLNGMSKDAVVKKYAPISGSHKNPDDTVSVWFGNGVYVNMRKAVVVRYGIYDTTAIGN